MGKVNEKYFKIGNDMAANNVEDILDKGESILFRTKPKKSAYIWSSVLKMMPFALLWTAFIVYSIVFACNMLAGVELRAYVIVLIVFAFLFMLTPLWIWLYGIVTSTIKYKNIEYVFTEKRIIIRSGLIGIDFKNIYYSDIEGVDLNVGFLDRILKVGDIYIKAKTQSSALLDIQNPYKLLSEIQKITLDIKTDIIFPNDLRPAENSGYATKYVKSEADKQVGETEEKESKNVDLQEK